MGESRLFRIMYHLIEKGGASAPELAELLEVSVRTVYRDVDALSAAGVPVYMERGRRGGIRLMDGFVLEKSGLSQKERAEVLLGLQSLGAARYPDADSALKKLSALFGMEAADWLEVHMARWGHDAAEEQACFLLLRQAALQRRSVTFTYYSEKGEVTRREAEPCRLVYREHAWYVHAFCRRRRDFRLFRLSRMADVGVSGRHFSRDRSPVAWTPSESPASAVDLVLRSEESAAYRLYDTFRRSAIRKAGGVLEVSERVPATEWLYGYLLSLGDALISVKPRAVGEELLRRHLAAAGKLAGDGES